MVAARERHETALAAFNAGRLTEAEEAWRAVIAELPDHTDALFHLAGVLLRLDRPAEALEAADRAHALDPQSAHFLNARGQILVRLKRFDEAETAFVAALARDPRDPDAYANLGALQFEAGRYEEAEFTLRKALIYHPNHRGAATNLGRSLLRLHRPEEAIALFHALIEIQQDDANAIVNLGIGATLTGDLNSAREAFERALAIAPANVEAHVNYAHILLLQGELDAGFREHEWRLRRPGYRDFSGFISPLWKGEDLAGKTILLWAEQGLGDAIQFIRYAPLVAARGARVIVECNPVLHRLVATMNGVAELVSQGEATGYDFHVPMMSVPLRFGPDAGMQDVPYLPLPPAIDLGRGAGLRVGLVWAGNPQHARDRERSRPLVEFASLAAARPDARFYALQKGEAAQQAAPRGMSLIHMGDRLHDFADTAAVMAALDLVITIDSAPAHLAGALGIPVWVLLSRLPDWRWGLEPEETTHWYPTMRLFRERMGWDDVFGRVAEALRVLEKPHGLVLP